MSSARRRAPWAALLAALTLAACQSTITADPTTADPTTADPTTAEPSAPAANTAGPLFYARGGSLYVSAPAGSPGRKLTDGPADTQPAPSPDLTHVAFVRKAVASDYGGELWVLDLSEQLTPVSPPRRLVDPETLPQGGPDTFPQINSPRWSPDGQRVAFVDSPNNGAVPGGILLVAAADTGVLEAKQQVPGAAWEPFAETGFSWAPDGRHIAWVSERSDVGPVNVNTLAAVGGRTARVATGTNASSVTYARDGQAILFTNRQAPPVGTPPYAVRAGGIYSVPTPGGAGPTPPSRPQPLFLREGASYHDLAVLDSGGLAFSSLGDRDTSKTIQVLDNGSSLPRTTVTDVSVAPICHTTPRGGGVCHATQPPAWGAGDMLAYVDTSPERSLVVTDADNRDPRRVDTGVDSFAWAP